MTLGVFPTCRPARAEQDGHGNHDQAHVVRRSEPDTGQHRPEFWLRRHYQPHPPAVHNLWPPPGAHNANLPGSLSTADWNHHPHLSIAFMPCRLAASPCCAVYRTSRCLTLIISQQTALKRYGAAGRRSTWGAHECNGRKGLGRFQLLRGPGHEGGSGSHGRIHWVAAPERLRRTPAELHRGRPHRGLLWSLPGVPPDPSPPAVPYLIKSTICAGDGDATVEPGRQCHARVPGCLRDREISCNWSMLQQLSSCGNCGSCQCGHESLPDRGHLAARCLLVAGLHTKRSQTFLLEAIRCKQPSQWSSMPCMLPEFVPV